MKAIVINAIRVQRHVQPMWARVIRNAQTIAGLNSVSFSD